MEIERIDRIAIAVNDLDKAVDFFSDLLGIKFDLPADEHEEMGLKGVYSSFGLELVSPLGRGPDYIQRFLDKRGEGVFCIVIKVDEINEAVNHFTAKGLQIAGRVDPAEGDGQIEVALHPKDTFGVQIVLVQYEAPHPATCASRHNQTLVSKKVVKTI